MIALKEARQLVADSIGEEKTPTKSSLQTWVHKGVISGVESKTYTAKGLKAYYPERLPVEIITALSLKKRYNLKDIAKARQGINFNNFKKKVKNAVKIDDLIENSKSFEEIKAEYINKIKQTNNFEELDCLIKNFNDNLDWEQKKTRILLDYIEEYLKNSPYS